MKKATKSYDEAMAMLQQILQKIQHGEIGLEELEQKTKEAGELILYCREKLRHVENQLDVLMEEE